MNNGNDVTLQERAGMMEAGQPSKALSMFSDIREGFSLQANSNNSFSANNAKKILSHFDTNKNRVIKTLSKYADMGLSYIDKDFYILVRGNEVQFPLDYKAYARMAVQNARLAGFDLILEAGVIRQGFKKGYILKSDTGDETLVIANPMIGDIVCPWAKYKLLSSKTHEIVSSMVEVVPTDEYQKAMSAGGTNGGVGQIHKSYSTEGAKKIALRRVIKHISYLFPDMRELEILDNEQYNHSEQHRASNKTITNQADPMSGKDGLIDAEVTEISMSDV